jgi:hypothetical protein
MLRRTPLRRSRFMRTTRRSKYRRRLRDIPYMLAVKKLKCAARDLGQCYGVVEADHAGRRGIGQKCPDNETIPLCTRHHQHRTGFTGVFKHWNQARMREWLAFQIRVTQLIISDQQHQPSTP